MKTHLRFLRLLASTSLLVLSAAHQAGAQAPQAGPAKPAPTPEEVLASARQKRAESEAKLARSAALITPEVQKRMVEYTMRTREPGYRALFATWQLAATTGDKALEIIRQREIRVMAQQYHFMQKGEPFSAESRQALKTERESAEAELVTLLGQDHVDELTRHEKEVVADLVKRQPELQAKAAEAREKVNVAFGRLMESFTPEMQRKASEANLLKREPRYRALFGSWKLEAGTGDMAMKIIGEREAELVEQRIQLFEARASNDTGDTEHMEASKATREKAATELQLLLGPAHANELTKLEEEIAADARARAEEAVRNRAKEQ